MSLKHISGKCLVFLTQYENEARYTKASQINYIPVKILYILNTPSMIKNPLCLQGNDSNQPENASTASQLEHTKIFGRELKYF